MFDAELSSFLTKFHQLRRAGLTAHLDVDTCADKSWVGLRVMLGPDKHSHQPNVPNVKRRSPSYFRRQERRIAARATEKSILEDDVTAEEASNNIDTHKEVTNGEENAEEATTDFKCELCDFQSKSEIGVNIHMTRKHPNLEQIDGNSEIDEDWEKIYGPYDEEIEDRDSKKQ